MELFVFLEKSSYTVPRGDLVEETIQTWSKAVAGLKPQSLTIPCNEASTGAGKRVFQLLVETVIIKDHYRGGW